METSDGKRKIYLNITTLGFRNGNDEREFISEIDKAFDPLNSLDIFPSGISSYIKENTKILRE